MFKKEALAKYSTKLSLFVPATAETKLTENRV
jgi:hypothetical protein